MLTWQEKMIMQLYVARGCQTHSETITMQLPSYWRQALAARDKGFSVKGKIFSLIRTEYQKHNLDNCFSLTRQKRR